MWPRTCNGFIAQPNSFFNSFFAQPRIAKNLTDSAAAIRQDRVADIRIPQGLGNVRGAAGYRRWANSGEVGRAQGAGRRGCRGLLLLLGLGTCGHTGSTTEASCLCSRPPHHVPSLMPRGLPLWWGSGWQGGERLWHAAISLHVRDCHRESRRLPFQHGLCKGWLQPQGSWCLWQMIRKCPEIFLVSFLSKLFFCLNLYTFLRRM